MEVVSSRPLKALEKAIKQAGGIPALTRATGLTSDNIYMARYRLGYGLATDVSPVVALKIAGAPGVSVPARSMCPRLPKS